jgi:hypothetical protein
VAKKVTEHARKKAKDLLDGKVGIFKWCESEGTFNLSIMKPDLAEALQAEAVSVEEAQMLIKDSGCRGAAYIQMILEAL